MTLECNLWGLNLILKATENHLSFLLFVCFKGVPGSAMFWKDHCGSCVRMDVDV